MLIVPFCMGQNLLEFNALRNRIDQHLMVGLGTWASSNLVISGIGWATVPGGEARYFHQMNVMWNTVNLGLAIPGYIKARKAGSAFEFAETVHMQHKTEKIFLINTGLDIGYMAGGLILRTEAKSNPSKQDQFRGFGNSLLLQGGFLFAFDLTAYLIHQRHAKKSLYPIMNSLQLSSNGLGLKWIIGEREEKWRAYYVNRSLNY
jgi:hypothetical protein